MMKPVPTNYCLLQQNTEIVLFLNAITANNITQLMSDFVDIMITFTLHVTLLYIIWCSYILFNIKCLT